MGLEYANLARMWWALLAIPIIILFILRVRLRRRQVPTLLFWDQLLKEHPPRAWWRRLRNLIALLLQLAFLALLVGALIEPLWAWQKRDARHIVYVVDNSASLSARDEGESNTRLENVQTALHGMIESLRQEDTAAIVTGGGLPKVSLGTTGDVRMLADAVDRVKASDNPSQLKEAVELARRLKGREGKLEIVVLTDGVDPSVAEFLEAPDVTVYGFGQDTGNVGITSFQVRRSIADVTSFQVLVEVTNFGEETVECRLDLELEGNIVDVIPLTLEPDKPWRETLDHISPEGGRLVAKLDRDDALTSDNQAVAVLPGQDPIPVVLVTPGSLFLRSVFESIPNVALTIAETAPTEWPANAILVVHQTKLETVPAGSVIVIEPQSDSDLWTMGEALPEPIIATQADSPLLAHTKLQNVILPGAKELQFSQKAEPLLQSPTETSLYTRLPRASGDVLVLSVKLNDGDLPLRIAFPVMIKNALESFLGGKGELRPALATGQSTSLPTGYTQKPIRDLIETEKNEGGKSPLETTAEKTTSLVLRSPSGELKKLPSTSEQVNVGPLDAVGVWWVGLESQINQSEEPSIDNEDISSIAVNLANPTESDLRPRTELPSPPEVSGVWGGHSLWFYLTLGATVGICLEWILHQRRIVA